MNEPSVVESSVPEKKKKVSFSQYAMWMKCPHSWYLNYAKGLRRKDANLSIFFGTAMHHALQTFIETLYTKGAADAHEIDVKKLFIDKFNEELSKEKEKPTTGPDNVFSYTEDEYKEFLYDSDDIIDFFLSNGNRIKYFPTKKYEFIGVEIPLDMEILHNVNFIAFIDLVLRDKVTGKYKIFDLKTSAVGWNNYMKEDESKFSQVLLYKAFYSKKFNVALSDIDVEFFILKRKLYENVAFPQSRIQTFTPTHNHNSISDALDGFINFVQECFTHNGNYNLERQYLKIPGKAKKNCKYCKHYKSTCDGKADKIEAEII
jgi:hypothetical protein